MPSGSSLAPDFRSEAKASECAHDGSLKGCAALVRRFLDFLYMLLDLIPDKASRLLKAPP